MDNFKPNESQNIGSQGSLNPFEGRNTAEELELPHVDQLLDCCKKTIKMHAANNPMMVCPDCKQIIKCFDEDRPYKNYQRFCASRHRKILATEFDGRYVVVFKSYEMYSS